MKRMVYYTFGKKTFLRKSVINFVLLLQILQDVGI